MKSRRKRIMKGVVLAFAVAAFAAPVAQAREFVASSTSSATSSYAPQQLRALELRSQGMDERYGLVNSVSNIRTTKPSVLVDARGGFSWGDASIGAATTFATALVVLFAVGTVRRRQPLGI
jgi:hypothetical protein